MNQVDKIKEWHEYGQPIFEELFKLNDDDLKNKVDEIIEGKFADIFHKTTKCVRIIIDGVPDEIKFSSYDSLTINWMGIHYKPEHGGSNIIVKFNKFFKLD